MTLGLNAAPLLFVIVLMLEIEQVVLAYSLKDGLFTNSVFALFIFHRGRTRRPLPRLGIGLRTISN